MRPLKYSIKDLFTCQSAISSHPESPSGPPSGSWPPGVEVHCSHPRTSRETRSSLQLVLTSALSQVEDTFQEGQEKEEQPEEKGDIKAEDDAIEMTDDFDGQMHDGDGEEKGTAYTPLDCGLTHHTWTVVLT